MKTAFMENCWPDITEQVPEKRREQPVVQLYDTTCLMILDGHNK